VIDPAERRVRQAARRGDAGADATVRMTHVLGVDDVTTPDPTEDYHEASRLYPGVVDPGVRGGAQLEQSAELRATVSRAVKRHPGRPFHALPEQRRLDATLADTLALRRSRRAFDERPLALDALGTVLGAAYGVTGVLAGGGQDLRSAPSGGALYPLELYVAARRVEGLEPALHHYDPLRHGLERLGGVPLDLLPTLSPYPETLRASAALLVLSCVFWRSRFKYGDRAYRFALIEAGHVGQNIALAAAALGLATVPIGGFFDRRVDALLGVDGVHEAALYLFPLGHPAA
jgi:SagB-type dehydrogenase family enzyme